MSRSEGTTVLSNAQPDAVLRDLDILEGVPKRVADLIRNSFTTHEFGFGDVVVRAGDAADSFWVVADGQLRVTAEADDGTEITLDRFGPGDQFGEIGILTGQRRTATVRASAPSIAHRLDGGVLRGLARTEPSLSIRLERIARRRQVAGLLRVDGPFGQLQGNALDDLLDALEPVEVHAGAQLIAQGDGEGPLFVVADGELEITRDGERLGTATRGDIVGELAVLTNQPRAATVTATTDATLWSLDQDSVQALRTKHPLFANALEALRLRHERANRMGGPSEYDQELLPAEVDLTQPEVEDFEATTRTVVASSREGVRPWWRPFPHIAQVDEADCGAACLAMIARHHGKRISLTRARSAAHVGVDGASLAGLARGGRELGFEVRPIKASKANLDQVALPAVAHWDAVHWLVVHRVTAVFVYVSDPALTRLRIPREEFERRWTGYLALFQPTPAFDDLPEDRSDLRWVVPFLRAERKALGLGATLAILVSLIQLSIPEATKRIFDEVLEQGREDLLVPTIMAIVAAVLLIGTSSLLRGWLLASSAIRIDAGTLDHVSNRLLSLPMRYFYARRTGDIQRRLAGTRQIRGFLLSLGQAGITSTLTLVVSLTYMFLTSWRLTAVWLAAVPFYLVLMRASVVRLRPLLGRLEEAFAGYSSKQIDAIKGIESIKAAGGEESYRGSLVEQFRKLADKQLSADLATMSYSAVITWVGLAVTAAYLYVGTRLVLDAAAAAPAGVTPTFTKGDFVAFQTIMAFATGSLLGLLRLFDASQFIAVLGERLHDVLSHDPEQAEEAGRETVRQLQGRVTFDEVTFRFGGPDSAAILDGISLEVTPGTTIAIVGRSGSGKTTLVKCLAGLLTPDAGAIRFDGKDLVELDLPSLRRNIGFVLQDNHLFSDTITANIAFGVDDPDPERVRWAATAANAHEFITRLPLGYETKVGESGLLLSGGQRQRLAIARAIHQDPAILILDEATSALDTESERTVQDNIERLLQGRTSFVIAHRLSTIRNADIILVLERGRIVEQGPHEALMAREGLYRHLVSQQLGV